MEELITRNKYLTKTVQVPDSFYKLNEKEAPITSATSFIKISENQPNTSDNEILEPSLEEESRYLDKTPSNTVIDTQTPILQNSLSSENVETPHTRYQKILECDL